MFYLKYVKMNIDRWAFIRSYSYAYRECILVDREDA